MATTICPAFDSLPLQKDGPRGNAWGLYGARDELGMLNLLTPEATVAAAKEIKDGTRVSTDWPLDRLKVPFFSRKIFTQEIHHKSPRTVNDDILTFNTQSSSQWDGFRHYGYQDCQLYFNGTPQSDIINTKKNGIHVWLENGGIVGRGVLLDYQSWIESHDLNSDAFSATTISASVLKEIANAQNISFRPGDILLVRSGYGKAFNDLSQEEANSLAMRVPHAAIGVESSEATLRWIWDKQFAAVAGDMPAFETCPFQNPEFTLHEWLLAGWGLPIGEFFDLEELASKCKEKGRWTFFFSSMPLNVTGGVASPPNGVAIF